jgi:hypothetical protein
MTKRINAIKAYAPSVKLQHRITTDTICEYISRQSSLNSGDIMNVLIHLHESILFFAQGGHPVKLEGIGTFTPTIHIDGSFNLNVRVDRSLVHKLNKQGAVRAKVINRANIGVIADDLVRQWNEHHPDDPVE